MAYDANLKRLPDPTTNPSGPGFISQQLVPVDPGMLHELNTGGSIGVQFEGSYWTINIAYPQLTVSEADVIIPFLSSLRGSFTNLYISLPTKTIPKTGRWSSDSVFLGDMTVSPTDDRVLIIDGWSETYGTLSVGDLIKLSNSHKIYMVTGLSVVSSDLHVELNAPIVNASTLIGASLYPNDIKFRVRLQGQFTPPTLTTEGLYAGFSVQFKENIL